MAVARTKKGKHRPGLGMMRMIHARHLEDLAVFVVVAEHASFVEASRRTRIPTSSVSRAVGRLEQDLGVRLLQRTSRRVVATEEGRQLLLRAAPLVTELEDVLRTVADRRAEPSGLVRVTAPAFTGATRVAALLGAFARAHPRVTIELDASNAVRDVVEDRFDLALRVGPLADAELVARHLWDVPSGLFASEDLVARTLRGRTSISRAQLERAPAVVTRAGGTWRFRRADGSVTEITPSARFTVNDPRAAVEVARHGVGIVLTPEPAAEGRGLVRLRTDAGEPVPAQVYAVYPSRRLLAARVRLVLEWLAAPDARTKTDSRARAG